MTANLSTKNCSPLSFVISSPHYTQALNLLRRAFLTTLLMGLIWLPGLPTHPALALPSFDTSRESTLPAVASAAEDVRMKALVTCLPKQLSQPNLKRALSEMGNDQIERMFNMKANPKLSQAEAELADCLSRQAS